jgi:hypothetical protein
LPLSCPSFSTVFRSFIRTACFRNLRDVYQAHPTARRDSCRFQPPSASGSTAQLRLVITAQIRHRYFLKNRICIKYPRSFWVIGLANQTL